MEAVYFYYSTASCRIDHTNSLHHCQHARLQLCVCDSALIKGLVFWLAGGVRLGRSRLSLSVSLARGSPRCQEQHYRIGSTRKIEQHRLYVQGESGD